MLDSFLMILRYLGEYLEETGLSLILNHNEVERPPSVAGAQFRGFA